MGAHALKPDWAEVDPVLCLVGEGGAPDQIESRPALPDQVRACTIIRVLLIEDDPIAAKQVLESLALADGTWFDVVQVSGISDARAQLNQGHFDVVLIDVAVSRRRSIGGFLRMIESWHKLPVVVLTGIRRRVQCEKLATLPIIRDGHRTRELIRSIHFAIGAHANSMCFVGANDAVPPASNDDSEFPQAVLGSERTSKAPHLRIC